MQVNGGSVTEATIVSSANGPVNNEGLTDIGPGCNINQQGQIQQQLQQPSQLRSSLSPIQHISSQTAANSQGPMNNNNHHQPHHHQHHHQQHQQQHQMASNLHHYDSLPQGGGGDGRGGGSYHNQRHSQNYHSQQPMQNYHSHHHKNKYDNRRNDNESNVNHVLLITVINPHYTITCDLIHQICSTYGKVNRIVIFKKNGVQAMVEFDNVESAKRAKSTLYGCDIYNGCCTLKIEYAKPTRLNIHRNDNDSFDYTNSNLATGQQTDDGSSAGGGPGPGVWNSAVDQHPMQNSQGSMASGSSHSAHHNSPHGSHHRGTVGGAADGHIVRGGHGSSSGGTGGHRSSHQFHHSHNQIPQPNSSHHQVSAVSSSTHHPGGNPLYTMDGRGEPSPADSFHQDGSFDGSRGGEHTGGGVPGPGAYVSGDSYMSSHSAGQHGSHSGMYTRHQDAHHSQNHSGPHHNSSFSGPNTNNPLMSGPSNLGALQGTVMMVYGLKLDRMNCDRLFNLFCLYGNVARIKFLKTKEGCAMVQMGDVLAVDRCIGSLNKIALFDSELQISYSKQAFLHDVIQPFVLPDGSPSFKDFMGNKNNRFKNPEVASKNRILPPSPVLHFFNAPSGITEDELVHLFKQTADHEPLTVRIFSPKAETIKSFSGLVTFKDSADATEALVMCNHLNLPKPGASNPYILRLCFSPPNHARQSHHAVNATPS